MVLVERCLLIKRKGSHVLESRSLGGSRTVLFLTCDPCWRFLLYYSTHYVTMPTKNILQDSVFSLTIICLPKKKWCLWM